MSGKAKAWVEEHFPGVQGTSKAVLILAYGAGLDEGLREAQEIIETASRIDLAALSALMCKDAP